MNLEKVMYELMTDNEHITSVKHPENQGAHLTRNELDSYYCLKAREQNNLTIKVN